MGTTASADTVPAQPRLTPAAPQGRSETPHWDGAGEDGAEQLGATPPALDLLPGGDRSAKGSEMLLGCPRLLRVPLAGTPVPDVGCTHQL